MSSPLPPMGQHPRHADENHKVLTIRRVEATDANGSRPNFGENAGRVSFGSVHTGRLKFGNTESAGFAKAESNSYAGNSGFSKIERSTFRASKITSTLGEGNSAELGSRGETSELHKAEDVELEAEREESKKGFGAGGYGAGIGVGGKLRSLRRGNKRTPYDRPATGRHATAGGSAAMPAVSLSPKLTVASRLRDSASRFIYSSASYVFSGLFKRIPPSVKAVGESNHAGVNIALDEEIFKETCQSPVKQIDLTSGPGPASQIPEFVDAGAKPMEAEGRGSEFVQVEEILKQKTWSREEVNQLTQILQTRVLENNTTDPILEAAEKSEVQPKPLVKDSSPVQVAREFMGEQATRPSGIAATVRKSSFLSTEIQPSPLHTLENRYLSSPFSRNWAQSSTAVRMPKRSLTREDDLASMGPVRRVRQKTSLANGSPYSWRMAGLSKPSETRTSSPPSQSTRTALKILETLEKLSPSPQGKFLEVSTEKSISGLRALEKFSPICKGKVSNEIVGVDGTSPGEQSPESSKAREKVLAQNLSSALSPKSTESKPVGKITFGGMNLINSEPAKKSVVEASSAFFESYGSMPVLGKGFRMNAVFEESNSDEEAKSQAKLHVYTESRATTAPYFLKEGATATADSVAGSSTAADPSGSFLLDTVQASTPSVLMKKSSIVPAAPLSLDKIEPSGTAVSQECVAAFPSSSLPPVAVETRLTLPASSPVAAAEEKVSMEKVLRVPSSAGVKPPSPAPFARQTGASEMTAASTTTLAFLSTSDEFAATALPLSASVGTTAPASLGNASTSVFLSPFPLTSKVVMDIPKVENAMTMATESPVAEKLAEVDTMATDSMAEEADSPTRAPPASPMPMSLFNANVQPSTGSTFPFTAGVSSTSSSAVTLPFDGGLGIASSGASASSSSAPSFVFGGQSSLASVGQPSNSLSGGSSFPSAAASTFGGQLSNAAVPTFAMGVLASSSSATSFVFGGKSGTTPVGQALSFAAKPSSLFDQSGTGSTGQATSFGALPSSTANPFSSTAGNLSSPFMFGSSTVAAFGSSTAPAFGSSAVSSTSSVFAFGSGGQPSFGASSTFQFGAPVGPSPSSASSMSPITTNSFSMSPFPSSPAPTLSANPAFSFGSSAAASSSAGSTPPGPVFAFGAAQPNPFAANPFSSSATQNLAPTFNFGAAAMAATSSSFSSSGSPMSMFASNTAPSTSNMFAFGSNSTLSTSSPFAFGSVQAAPVQAPMVTPPATFAFGSQPAAAPPASGQLFGFGGGQPAAPASNPFAAAGTTQPASEFTIGFAAGAASGDKGGRKYIKAKRLGAKRGK